MAVSVLVLSILTPASAQARPSLDVFYLRGCHDCEEFDEAIASTLIPGLARLGIEPSIGYFDVMTPSGYERLIYETGRLGWDYRGVPLLRAGDRFFFGDELASSRLADDVAIALKESLRPDPAGAARAGIAGERAAPRIGLWVAIAAGLVDGANPCAMATLLFMVSALALGGRSRRSVTAIGLSFVAGVFATYYLIGLGLLRAGTLLSAFPHAGSIVRLAGAVAVWILAGLSVRDWWLARSGNPQSLSLRLPPPLVRRLHSAIRGGASLWLSGLGALGLGVTVSLGEFVCTGQIYLPTLAYMAKAGKGATAFLLAAYNAAFIAPLAAVFLLVGAGMTHARLVAFFKARLALSKLALAVAFAVLGGLLLAGIERA